MSSGRQIIYQLSYKNMECAVCTITKQDVNECAKNNCTYTICNSCLESYQKSICPACRREHCFEIINHGRNDLLCLLPFELLCIGILLVIACMSYGMGYVFAVCVLDQPAPSTVLTFVYGYSIFIVVAWSVGAIYMVVNCFNYVYNTLPQ